MSLKIRLARGGAKNRPYYRVVVADSRMPRDGRYIERVGSYNPMLEHGDENRLVIREDRVKHWLSVGAQATDDDHVGDDHAHLGDVGRGQRQPDTEDSPGFGAPVRRPRFLQFVARCCCHLTLLDANRATICKFDDSSKHQLGSEQML